MEKNNKKRTRFMWPALVLTTLALCILCVFVILNLETNHTLIALGPQEKTPQSEKLSGEECIPVCNSEDCVMQSKLLLNVMQPTVDPCDDFNKFTCGHFGEFFPDGSWVNPLNDQRRMRSKTILENLRPRPDSSSDKMKIVYDSCISPESETKAVSTLLQILEEFGFKGWPHLASDFHFENTTIAKVIAKLLLRDEYGFVAISREDSPEHLEIPYILEVQMGHQIDPSVAMMDVENTAKEVRKLQIDSILKYFNLEAEMVTKIREEREAMDREIERLKMESKNFDPDFMPQNYTIVDCSGETENEWVDLCEVINSFLHFAQVNEEVSSKYVAINPGSVEYFIQNIFPLLRNFSDRAVAHYLALDVILNHLNDLNLYFRLTYQRNANEALRLFAMVSPIDRWQSCVDWISKSLTYAFLYEYGKKDFTVTMYKEIANLTDELIHVVAEYYSQQTWLPESYRKQKAKEIRNFTLMSPSMNHFPSDTTVSEFYDTFKPKSGNFLYNEMEYRKFKTVAKMRNKFLRGMHEKNIFTADAYGGGGQMEIGITFLQPPFFSIRSQRIFNLVPFGFVIAHEIGHSILDHFDYQNEEIGRKGNCLADQISQYRLELIGKNLDGFQYLAEEIADNIGASITDKITEKYLSKGVESFLPGLPFPTKELLYIKSALLFCSSTWKRKEELYAQGTHHPDDVRIYQRMRNSKVFSEVFNCPVGSFMNPADKCRILTDGRSI